MSIVYKHNMLTIADSELFELRVYREHDQMSTATVFLFLLDNLPGKLAKYTDTKYNEKGHIVRF